MSTNVNVEFTANTANVVQQMEKLDASLGNIKRTIEEQFSRIANWTTSISNIYKGAVKVFEKVREPVEKALNFEKSAKQLSVLTGSLEESKKILKQIRAESDAGGASFDELSSAAQMKAQNPNAFHQIISKQPQAAINKSDRHDRQKTIRPTTSPCDKSIFHNIISK